jgi:hypothetical protein
MTYRRRHIPALFLNILNPLADRSLLSHDQNPFQNRLGGTNVVVHLVRNTVGKFSTVRQYKKFSSTDGEFFWTVGIQALKCVSTAGTGNDPIVTEILY